MIEFLFGLTIGSLAATVTAFYFWVSSLDKRLHSKLDELAGVKK